MTAVVLGDARLVGGSHEAMDLLIDDGVVTEISPGQGGSVERVDLGGRFVGLGLWDAHVHMGQWAQVRRRVDLAGAESPRDVADRLREKAVTTDDFAADDIIVGYGFRDALWGEPMRRRMLDAAGDGRPLVAISGDLHCVWLNAAAARRLGVTAGATGVLREAAAIAIVTRLDAVADDQLDRWVDEASVAAAARGVVGVVDFEWDDNVRAWERRAARGPLRLRVRCGIYPEHLAAAIARGLRTGGPVRGSGGLATVGPLKVITDGSLNTKTALCHDPYPDAGPGGDAHGLANVGLEELKSLMRQASAGGLEPAVHAIGDRAAQLVLDAFESVGVAGSIEHAQLVGTSDLVRFGALGVTASVQPEHAMDDRDIADRLWAGRTSRAFAWRSLVDAGARLTLGSDAPVAPLDPWVAMAAAVSRSRDGRAPWHAEQSLTMAEAYAASTGAGRVDVRPGDPADLVVLEGDPLSWEGAAIRSAVVAGTMVAGRWTHREF